MDKLLESLSSRRFLVVYDFSLSTNSMDLISHTDSLNINASMQFSSFFP